MDLNEFNKSIRKTPAETICAYDGERYKVTIYLVDNEGNFNFMVEISTW